MTSKELTKNNDFEDFDDIASYNHFFFPNLINAERECIHF